MSRRGLVRFFVAGVSLVLAAVGLVVAREAGAQEFTRQRIAAVGSAPQPRLALPNVVFDPDVWSVGYFHEGVEANAGVQLSFINNGNMGLGDGYPLAPEYVLTVSVSTGYVSCFPGDVQTPATGPATRCATTLTKRWAPGQIISFGPMAYLAGNGVVVTYSMTIRHPDPDGAAGVLRIPPRPR
jgi:hypothetical protein